MFIDQVILNINIVECHSAKVASCDVQLSTLIVLLMMLILVIQCKAYLETYASETLPAQVNFLALG